MRQKYIAGNWKMNLSKAEAIALTKEMVVQLKDSPNKFMVAAPFVYLDAVAPILKGTNIVLAAQNMAIAEKGAYTGEVSASMLVDIGVDTVILGHSERRNLYGETDAIINEKVKLALAHNLNVVLCVGEQWEDREAGNVEITCEKQLRDALKGVTAEQMSHITIAYEPVWAIGTGKTPSPADAQEVHIFMRAVIAHKYGRPVAENVIIQYGGSVKAAIAPDFIAEPDIDGFLVGGASLAIDTFIPICKL